MIFTWAHKARFTAHHSGLLNAGAAKIQITIRQQTDTEHSNLLLPPHNHLDICRSHS